jgi:hypothetical protein
MDPAAPRTAGNPPPNDGVPPRVRQSPVGADFQVVTSRRTPEKHPFLAPRTAEECGFTAACIFSGLCLLQREKSTLNTALPAGPVGYPPAIFHSLKLLTIARGCPYISILRRADAHRRDGAPLKLHTTSRWERYPALSDALLRRLSGFPGRGLSSVPGCLKSKSEERETWTAESLRAASSTGEILSNGGRIRDFGGTRFRSTPLTVCGAQAS